MIGGEAGGSDGGESGGDDGGPGEGNHGGSGGDETTSDTAASTKPSMASETTRSVLVALNMCFAGTGVEHAKQGARADSGASRNACG